MFGYGGLFVVLAVLGLMGVVLMHYRVHLPSRGA